ncbi:DUF2787 domain-containing protein [Psychromonas ossibalaenae]|uniref:DUF2787 domain-containing protein n=1 Tax=Psychromonas ossibalaenae TaxID=444922 RepID=UPI00036F5B8F|nr:DUF2787 domain-containing protein [Psychromonas ossibalaenae]
MDIKFNQSVIKISSKLFVALKQSIKQQGIKGDVSQITFNYRDSSYSSEQGGYHPVEISLQKDVTDGRWSVLYITDFCYYGHPYAELTKELDFDFSLATFSTTYSQPRAITHASVKDIFTLWQHNFLSYLEYGAFDQIKVSSW